MKLPIIAIMIVLSLFCFAIFLWALIFYSYYTAFLAFLGVISFIPYKLNNKRFWLTKGIVFSIGLLLLITTIFIPINEINKRIDFLRKKPRVVSSFTIRDKIGIYGLNIMMGIFGYIMYPEVAKETLLLMFPPPKDGIRVFNSDFAIKSKKIKNIIKEFKNKLPYKGKELTYYKKVSWSGKDFSLSSGEARYALTLNPCKVFLKAIKKGSKYRIDVSLKVPVKYPKNSYITLISKPLELKVEEGLFWILQRAGWLFPYTAEWKFSIDSNEQRLNENNSNL